MKLFLLPFFLLPIAATAQISEDFSDENFNHSPVWTGDTAYWRINNGVLQSHFTASDANATTSFHLSTVSAFLQNTAWEFRMQLKFNTSSKNYVEVYVASDQEDPRCGLSSCNATHGYFVKIGSAQDDICLYRRDSSKDILLIKGRAGLTNHSNNILKIKVICDDHYQWSLYTDDTGTGTQYFPEGKATDSTYIISNYFSMVVFQSGKTAAEKHFFDNIKIVPFSPDTVPPFVKEIYTMDDHHVYLLFSEALDQKEAENVLNYTAGNGLMMPDSAILNPKARNLVQLYFEKNITQKQLYHIQLKNISDLAGNKLDTAVSFLYYEPLPYEVIIDEIYPDPSHSHGLPGFEYVELKNISSYPVNTEGWQFCNHTRCTVLPPWMLRPNHLVILCDIKADTSFAPYGKFINLKSLPTLNNNGDTLKILDKTGRVMHRVIYNKNTYQDKSKSGGGWSLEMKNTKIPCLGNSNWTASVDPLGGTPGKENSVREDEADPVPFLELRYIEVSDSMNIIAHFNIAPDNEVASHREHYLIYGNTVFTALPGLPSSNTVSLHLSFPLEKGKEYSLKVKNLAGCAQIQTGLEVETRFGIPEPADNFDVVINEILFHPKKGSQDFVELYNHSTKIIDIGSLQLANRNKENKVAAIKNITDTPYYLFPGEYVVITQDKSDLMRQYFCKSPDAIIEAASLPSYPNREGTVVLLAGNEKIIDEVPYHGNEHNELLHNQEGVSLERINDQGKSDDPQNWHSASSATGYATPTYLNSQSLTADFFDHVFEAVPKVFSPDNDGIDDQTNIIYHIAAPGYSGRISVFDSQGHLIRHLLNNALLGAHGKIIWDGKNDKMQIMPSGIYVIYAEIFNNQGKLRSYKIPVVLAKKTR
ncbi:MAG: hypothetical protein EPN37_00905 [Chitinophagaceae bacterium]|nr:MAG: hypothetical protein EPN37_00905 [Chitinophagaceae bacterium]